MINLEYLEKIAKESYELKDYQKRVVDKVVGDSDSKTRVIALHSMGSGKTLTALSAMNEVLKEKPNAKMLYIVPAPLVERTPAEIKRYNLKNLKNKLNVMSYENASKLHNTDKTKRYDIIAVDEAHRLRNANSQRAQNIQKLLDKSDRVLFLTGTMGYNHPADMFSLINRLNPDLKLPEDHSTFNARYVDDTSGTLKHKKEISNILNKYVDMYKVSEKNEHFPTYSTSIIRVPMTDAQEELYRYTERSLPSYLVEKIRKGRVLSGEEARIANFFMQGVRQISNTTNKYDTIAQSPKIQLAATNLVNKAKNNKDFRGVVYTNYLQSGIYPYINTLKDKGITSYVYTGSTPVKEKERIIKEYNKVDKKPKVLILSSAGGEGLDLKRTTLMQILEPHFNESKIDQAKARTIRYDSHKDLPANKRHVDIEEYRSSFAGRPDLHTIDDTLAVISQRKQSIVNQMEDLIGKPPPEDTLMDILDDYNPFSKNKKVKKVKYRSIKI